MTPFDDQRESRDPLVATLGEASHLDEEHLRRVLDAIPAPVSYIDTGLCFRYNNCAYDAWVGRPHEELYGMHVSEVLGEKAYAPVLPYMQEALAGRAAHFERELEYPDGSKRYVSVSYIPDFDAEGSVQGFVASVRDLTERRRAEDSIRLQAHLLATVEQAIIATDLEGRVIYWNGHAERLYGWPAAEAVGRNILEVTPDAGEGTQATEIMSRLAAGETWSGEFKVRRRDGSSFPALVTDTPIHDESGRFVGVVGVSTDLPQRKGSQAAGDRGEAG